uniref:thymus high mobility group box protein TOX n=1 Tax=Mus musculus TaxID=10090 RepID=UPI00005FB085|nr:Chain A, thymus high mobility group box protein TOX [Mus musculus]
GSSGSSGKKKKKKDPNEPQKPVSAYALFFRDTQAAIKGQNPNATFGEVSKIVASMWDGLGEEQKQVYKKKTEAAKKEYLKQLAAYRASLVSKSYTDSGPSSG